MRTWEDIREKQTAIPKEELSLIDTLSFLQAQRIKQEISQTEFAKRINMTQPQLAKIDSLISNPRPLAYLFNVDKVGVESKFSILASCG